MLSVFIMYSNDRWKQLELTIASLRAMKHFEACQKTLVVDGRMKGDPGEFEVVQVPRIDGKFCWSNMWSAGVLTALHQTVLYLDSDRLLPSDYLERVLDSVNDNNFVFTSRHFMVIEELTSQECLEFLGYKDFIDERFIGSVRYEPRFLDPIPGPGKNVMSGNTAFRKSTYLRLGGVDPWYCGHGAFADTDFHTQAAAAGCTFTDLECPELHYHHAKKDDANSDIDEMTLRRMGLDNFIYYCHKWGHPMVLAESLAYNCGLSNARKYVREELKDISKGSA